MRHLEVVTVNVHCCYFLSRTSVCDLRLTPPYLKLDSLDYLISTMSALSMVIFSGKIVRHGIRNTRKDTFTLVATVIQTRSNHPDLPHQAMELKDKHNISFFLRKKIRIIMKQACKIQQNSLVGGPCIMISKHIIIYFLM
jgi:hypothetical protein